MAELQRTEKNLSTIQDITSSVAKRVPLIMILWPLPCGYAGEIKGDYEISAGGHKEAPQGYYTHEGILMIYNTCTWYMTYG